MNRLFVSFCGLLSLSTACGFASNIDFKLCGDSEKGFYVNLTDGNKTISDNSLSGELSLYFDNEDYSVREELQNWKASVAENYGDSVVLSGRVYLKKLETYVKLNVIYKKLDSDLIEKRMELEQNNIPLLYFSLGTSISPGDTPVTFWSFDDNGNNGGIVHETYPAAGYMIGENTAVGMLTDAGNRNKWTRNIRRRPSKQGEVGFRAIKEICDAGMIRISDLEERDKGNSFVRYTFGEVSDFNHPKSQHSYEIPSVKLWKSVNGADVKRKVMFM